MKVFVKLPQLIEDPPVEDSPNLSDEEIAGAIPTASINELVQKLKDAARDGIQQHELLRRGESLFWRVTVRDGVDNVLVFRADWLGVN